jgi:hypothetical protein
MIILHRAMRILASTEMDAHLQASYESLKKRIYQAQLSTNHIISMMGYTKQSLKSIIIKVWHRN